MAQTVSKRSRKLWLAFVIIGLLSLVVFLVRSRPKNLLYRILKRAGASPDTAKMWVAVSAFETDGWTSINFKRDNNPAGLTLANKETTALGLAPDPNPEALARYGSKRAGYNDLALYMFTRWNYPGQFTSISSLVSFMQSKGYFTGDQVTYASGVQLWYNKLFQ